MAVYESEPRYELPVCSPRFGTVSKWGQQVVSKTCYWAELRVLPGLGKAYSNKRWVTCTIAKRPELLIMSRMIRSGSGGGRMRDSSSTGLHFFYFVDVLPVWHLGIVVSDFLIDYLTKKELFEWKGLYCFYSWKVIFIWPRPFVFQLDGGAITTGLTGTLSQSSLSL